MAAISMSDSDLVQLRKWALSSALGQPSAGWTTIDFLQAAAAFEGYVLGLDPLLMGGVADSTDTSEAAPVEVEDVGLGHAAFRAAVGSVVGGNQAADEQLVGDGLAAAVGGLVAHGSDPSIGGVTTPMVAEGEASGNAASPGAPST